MSFPENEQVSSPEYSLFQGGVQGKVVRAVVDRLNNLPVAITVMFVATLFFVEKSPSLIPVLYYLPAIVLAWSLVNYLWLQPKRAAEQPSDASISPSVSL